MLSPPLSAGQLIRNSDYLCSRMRYRFLNIPVCLIVMCWMHIAIHPAFSQFESVFSRPYPERLQSMDTFMTICYMREPQDFKAGDSMAEKIIRYAKQNRDIYDQLNLRQQRLNSIYTWTLSKGMSYPQFITEANQILEESRYSKFRNIEARMFSLIGQYYFTIENDCRKAFENLIKSKEIYQTLSIVEFPEKAYSYYVFAMKYYEFNDYESALIISKELEAQDKVQYDIQVLNNDLMGECYVNLMKFDSARICFQKVLDLASVSNYNTIAWIGIANGKIGETWFYQEDYQKAEPLLLKGLDTCMKPEIALWDNITVFAAKLSKIYLNKGMLTQAYKYAEISRTGALKYEKIGYVNKKLKSYKFRMNYYRAFGEYFRAKPDYAEAVKYQDSFLIYKDKIQNLIDVNEKYNAQIAINKEKEEKKEQIAQKERQQQSLIRNSLIGLLIMLFLVFLLFYNWITQKQKNKDQKFIAENILREKQLELELQSKNNEIEQRKLLEIKNAVIEKSLLEKDVLLNEIHHRVKNNLQIISSLLELQSNRLNDENAKAAIEEGKGRVLSIALVHQQLYQKGDFSFVEIKPFIRELVTQVSGSLKSDEMKFDVIYNLDSAIIPIDSAIPLGLILNELLTNSFKYAFQGKQEGRIEINIKVKEVKEDSSTGIEQKVFDTLDTFMYKDNGPGLPGTINIKKSESLGLKLINQLSKQIKGNVEYHYENGACFVIIF